MSRYILTEQAEQDLNDIWDYVADQSADQADVVVKRFVRHSSFSRPCQARAIAAAT